MDIDYTTLEFNGRDEFNRKPIAEKVIKLLSSDIDISPMVIDGSWGTGKTEFCHKLINLMKEDCSHNLIYIDAFKADHVNEPLMTVLAEIIKILPEGPRRKAFINRVLPAVRYTLKTVAKAGVSHLLRQDFADLVSDFDSEIQKVADDSIDKTAELILKDHVEAEKNLQTLQTALTAIASKNPIVIFIDELDRCRPNFAIDMLEVIKHTFNVEGVQFVLVTNTQQLKASINHCYGQAVDAQRYLDKFIKYRFELSALSDRDLHIPVLAAKKYFFALARERKIVTPNNLSGKNFEEAVECLIRARNLSLREIETLIRHIKIAQILSDEQAFNGNKRFGFVLTDLISVMLVCFKPELLNQMKNDSFDIDALGEFLGVRKILFDDQESTRPSAMEVMMVAFAKDSNKSNSKYTPPEDKIEIWEYYTQSFVGNELYDASPISEIIKTANILSFE